MIKTLSGQGHVVVQNGNPSSSYYQNGLPMSGMVRYYNNNFEVYDGTTWMIIQTGYATVSLSGTAEAAINWAMKQMAEEAELENLAKTHPAVLAAYETWKRAGDQLKTTIILSKDEQSTS